MTSPEFSDRRRLFRSSLVAAAFWLVLGATLSLVSFVAPAKPVRQFMPVHLTLAAPVASSAVVAPTSAANPAASTARSAARSVPAAGSKSPKPAAGKTTAAKTSQAKTAGGLGIPNFSSAPSSGSSRAGSGSVSGNSLDFASSGDQAAPVSSQAPKGSNAVAEFEGSAASVVSPSSRGSGKTARSGGSSGSQGSAVSGDTNASLGDIAAAAKSGSSGLSGGVSGNHGGASGSPSGGQGGGKTGGSANSGMVSGIAFDGASRKLLYPAKPVIALPDNLAKLVDSSRAVTVTFSVLADGTVPAGAISFTPSAILPAEVRDYLRREFSSWRFEKSSEDGQARFLYSIKVE